MKNTNLTTNEMRILSALDEKQMYGYEIIQEIEKVGGFKLLLGSLYNTLKILERKGFIGGKWSNKTTSGGRRKYFKITGKGRRVFFDAKTELSLLLQWGKLSPLPTQER